MTVTLEVGYSWTAIHGADDFLLHMLDEETKFPTAVASAHEAGIELKDEAGEPLTWDGWIHLLRITKTLPPRLPTGLLETIQRLCQKYGYLSETKDQRVRPELGFPEPAVTSLRDYQERAATQAIAVGRGILDMPPRSGKTRTMMEIHRRLALPTVWIVPTDRIAKQTLATAEGFFGKNYATHLVGSGEQKEAASLNLVVCTAATARALHPEFWKSRQVLVIDEWHHAAAKTYWDIVMRKCEHIYFRYGMTGTHFRSGEDELAMHALLSNVIFKITSAELKERGFLVETDVLFVPVLANKIRIPGSDPTFINGHGRHGIHEHAYRNQLVAHAAAVLAQAGKKVLVLVGTKVQGHEVARVLKGLLPDKAPGAQFEKAEFVSTDASRKKIDKILDSFNTLRDEVLVLVGTSLVGEGVDLPVADALVYAKGESAEVGLIQSAFRVATTQPGKTRAVIVDFADRHHRKLMQHSLERLESYHGEAIFKVRVLEGMAGFISYLKAGTSP